MTPSPVLRPMLISRSLLGRLCFPLLLFVLLGGLWPLAQTTATASPDQPPLLAFYYGWFDTQTWNSGQVLDQPLQPYRSSDPATIARHVAQAQQAGIDGFVMSWYGPQIAYNQTEPNFRLLLAEAERRSFKAAIDFETRSPFYATRANVVAGLKYLINTHAQHPAYFQFNGKPVIFFWQQERFSVAEWQSIRQEVDPHHTTLWIADGTDLGYQAYFDGHHLYNIAWANDVAGTLLHWRNLVRWYDWFFKVDRYWVATTMPGFDERHLGRESKNYRNRGTGEFYIESWRAAMATQPDMLIITSFNEWPENSQIEPSVSYGNYYLDLTRALRTNQVLPPTPVLPTPTPTATPGHGSLIGLITDAATGERLAGVHVAVDGQTTTSNTQGSYTFAGVSEGLQVVTARHPGYLTTEKPRIVVKNQLVWNSIALPPGLDSPAPPTPAATATKTPSPTATPPSTSFATATSTATQTPPATAAPQPGTLTGLVTNAQTGQALGGVGIMVAGQEGRSNESGIYRVEGLPAGPVTVAVNHPGFQPVAQTASVVSQQVRWHSIALWPQFTPTSTPTASTPAAGGKLIGLLTNAQTGERLTGVIVTVAGQTMPTDSRGVYMFDNLPVGQQTVVVKPPGFQPVAETTTILAGQTRWHSMALKPINTPTSVPTTIPTSSPIFTLTPTPIVTITPSATPGAPTATPGAPTATPGAPTATPGAPTATPGAPTATPGASTGSLVGLITNRHSGERLVGVTISAAGQTTWTNERGVYTLAALPVGQHQVRAEHAGFEPVTQLAYVAAGQTRWNSMTLAPVSAPPSASPTSSPTNLPVVTATPGPTFTATPLPPSTATPSPSPTPQPVDPCSTILGESYGTLAIVGAPSDRPAAEHADLNLALRGYAPTAAYPGLIDLEGGRDDGAPQLPGLFANQRTGEFNAVYQVYHWDWPTNSRGGRITDPAVTLAGLRVERGETIHVPGSGYSIGQGYSVLVLYANTQRITLKFTGEDNVIFGYTLHIEGICVDPNLRSLYAQMNATGRSRLPALRPGQAFGRAVDTEIGVAIRDNGRFMDPRARKDWWRGR